MRRCSGLLLLAAALVAVPSSAFATSVLNINFTPILQYVHDQFNALAGVTEYNPATADWTMEHGRGILDVEEFGLISLILADTAAPQHDAIHAAFVNNQTRMRAAIGTTIMGLTTASGASYGLDAIMGAYLTMGEWDNVDVVMVGLKTSAFGSKVMWPTEEGMNEAQKVNYVLDQFPYLGVCGDADGDTVINGYEFWAASPNSFVNAINAGVTAQAMKWSTWGVCTDTVIRWAYNPTTKRVYTMSATEVTQAEIASMTYGWPGGSTIPMTLAEIRSAEENAFVFSVTGGETAWLGCSDAGNDIGSVAPNPDDWYWLTTPTESMVYRNWRSGEPNGVNGGEDFGTLRSDGQWNDVGGGTRLEYVAAVSINTYDDLDSNGAPDMFEDKNGDLVPDGFGVPKPTCDFSATPLSGDMPLVVTFTDLSTVGAGEPAITEWAWDFGNGQTSTLQSPPAVTYMAADPSSTYTVTLEVTNENGTSTKTKTNYITVQYVCEFAGVLNAQGPELNAFIAAPGSIGADVQALLEDVAVVDWEDWDVEGLEALVGNPSAVVGDGLIDAAQIALVAEVVCNTDLEANATVYADMTANKALFLDDIETLAGGDPDIEALADFADIFAALLGISPEMQATANEMIAMMAGADLPSLASYVVFDGVAKAGPLFAAGGDVDGDGETNLEEWEAVVAAGGGVALFVDAATDPNNLWPGNPDLPVAGIVGLGLLAGGMLMSAAFALRKK